MNNVINRLKWLTTLLLAASIGWIAFHSDMLASVEGRRHVSELIVLVYLAFCIATFYVVKWQARSHQQAVSVSARGSHQTTLVIYASQTGAAEELAWGTSGFLANIGESVNVRALDQVTIEDLAQHDRALFIVSTTGEGDAPDNANRFLNAMIQPAHLPNLSYALLALGDRSFSYFCAFGHRLNEWLAASAAQPLFDMIEVDNGDEKAVGDWQQQLADLHQTDSSSAIAQTFSPWKLVERHWINPGSPGAPAYDLVLQWDGDGPQPTWQAGDIAEVLPCNAPAKVQLILQALNVPGDSRITTPSGPSTMAEQLSISMLPSADRIQHFKGLSAQQIADTLEKLPKRDFSIASTPNEQQLRLLVRLVHDAHGQPGIGSGWLTQYAPLHQPILIKIRRNRNFHGPKNDKPMILIGNGTGIAGLRAHLVERIQDGQYRNWLIFGERTRAHDGFYRHELSQWLSEGRLEKANFTFSRDNMPQRYVQDALRAEADRFRTWIDAGACIYMCGSQQGMSQDVLTAIEQILGVDATQQLLASVRLRKDVY